MLAAGLTLLAGAPAAFAQSVSGSGDIAPVLPTPRPSWSPSPGQLFVGLSGTGTLTIENGGSVSTSETRVGWRASGIGTVTVTGTGSAWTNSGLLYVGEAGTGTLAIENGGTVTSGSLTYIGSSSGGTGKVTVTGAGSTWTNNDALYVGREGTGTLIIEDGGTVSNAKGFVGWQTGSFGTVTVTGVGSTWTNTDLLRVGFFGTGTLTIEKGGTVSNTDAFVGDRAGSTGTVTVTGAGSSWTNNGTLNVGYSGTSTLTIADGGTVTSAGAGGPAGSIGVMAGSTGTVKVTGSGSTWLNNGMLGDGELYVGQAGTGTLIVENGGWVKSTSGYLGYASGGSGTVTVTGTDSRWTVIGLLDVGRDGIGTLTIANGGAIESNGTEIGRNGAGTGSVTVTGAGSALYTRGIAIGENGTLTVENGGYVQGRGGVIFYGSGGGTLNLLGDATNGRGVLEINYLTANHGTVNLNGGILRARMSSSWFFDSVGVQTIGANGAFFDSNGYDIGVSASFDGSGGLTKLGAGRLTLSGTNSYSGATTVSGGALQAGQAGSFSQNSAFTVDAGATLDLAGFDHTIRSFAGAGTISLGAGSLTAGSDNTSTTFSGAITGTGKVTKTGTGTLTLTGVNTYTGDTVISGGKLVVNGSLASNVMLAGGALGGSGTIGGVTVQSGTTVAPGNSIGTLNVAGNISFASGSTYQVEINAAGQSDRIAATGSAMITGGTVQVLAEAGNYAASTSYTILTAAGGVTGTFTSATSNLAFLTPSLSYGGQNVTLIMTRNSTGFGPGDGGAGGGTPSTFIAQTRNQGFIAIAAERPGAGNPVYDALLSGTAAEARAGFDLLSGEAHAQAVSVMIDESRLVRDTILNRLRGPLLTQAGSQVAAAFSADLPGRKGAVVMPAPVPQPRYAFWGEAFGGAGNTNADGNAAGMSRRSGGALLGADVMLYDAPGSSLKVGVAGGYSQSRFDLDARLSTGKLESGHAGLYAGARFGNLRLDAGAAYSWSESDIRRQVQIRGFGDALRLQRPGAVMQGFAELGYGFAFSGFALEPFAQLALIRVSTEAGTERGGAAALRVLSSDQTLGFATLGLRAEAQIGAMPLFARAMLGWRHGFGELTPQASTAFVTGTTPAQVFAARIDREALVAEAGLDWRLSQATTLGLTYSAAIGERARDHALKGRVEMRF
jgi:outer membrane autotransporter protein